MSKLPCFLTISQEDGIDSNLKTECYGGAMNGIYQDVKKSSYDCGFTRDSSWFRYREAAIIVENDCVLFAGNEIEDYYYSIGGGVHMGETVEDAVKRFRLP